MDHYYEWYMSENQKVRFAKMKLTMQAKLYINNVERLLQHDRQEPIGSYIRINEKACKIIIDSRSCVNVIATTTVSRTSLTPESHPNSYKVSWFNTSSMEVAQRCLVLIRFNSYQDKVWCDVLLMEVGSIILGRLWLYDLDITLRG
ncbi:hypothetical protein AXF42_Ash016829 [Apostasia shenzhenica]|uniref:Uncharacterized protein n=1 Tax=Apostasia shenzhenica TaxID=1088818 RepID=A0A2I0BAH1_9ASPA|nr:hypothetical protein AXF42_Ash016829 [Apostasia shenzhenica]